MAKGGASVSTGRATEPVGVLSLGPWSPGVYLPIFALILAVVVFAIVAYGLDLEPPLKQWWSDGFWTVFSALATLQSYRAWRSLTGPLKRAWGMFTLGTASWLAGMLFWDYNELIVGEITPYPSLSDTGFLAYAVFFLVGFLYFRADAPTAKVSLRKIAGIGTIISAYLIVFVLVFAEDIIEGDFGLLYLVTSIAWSVVYFAAAVSAIYSMIMLTSRRHISVLSLLFTSIVLQTIVGTQYAAALLDKEYQAGSYLDVLWLIALALDFACATKQLHDRGAAVSPTEAQGQNTFNIFDSLTTICTLLFTSIIIYLYLDSIDGTIMRIILPIIVLMVLFVCLREWAERKVHETLLAARDRAIGDLYLSEARFRTIAEGSLVCLLITRRANGIILYANPIVGPVLGETKEHLEGRDIADFLSNPSGREEWMRELDREGLIADLTLEMRRVDGKKITTTHSLRLIEFGGEEAILSSFQDVTERDRLEELLRRSQRMEAIGQLTGGVAHDFNNVLAIILGYLDLAKSELPPGSKLLNYVNPAFAAAQNASELTRRLLTFARKQSLQVQATDVAALLDGMVIIIRRSLGESIEIKITNPPGLWPCLTDAAQLEQAILNLAVNARDAMPEGGILEFETSTVCINDSNADDHPLVEPGNYVRLSVQDSGIGMSQDVQMLIFDPFFTTKDVGKGTGLGLSMVYGIIKQSGGHIVVRSEPGDGTTFCIFLPRTESQPDIPRQTVETSISNERPGKTILAVEDDPELRQMVGKMLDDLGYDVLLASDGAEALRTLSNAAHVDVLLTDVILPGGMSGPALAEIAVTERAAIKTLYMSGYADTAFADLGRPELESELLKKPFTKADLGDRLRAALNS